MEKQAKAFNPITIRKDFPLLDQIVNKRPLVYFDNAATTQKPMAVIEAITNYYTQYNSNVHRGVHSLSRKATIAFEEVRTVIKEFLNARYSYEIIYTRGTTESINLVANTWGMENIEQGDEILISELEHHSNIVPWQMLCERKQAKLKVIPIREDGSLNMDAYRQLLNERVKLVAITHVSNSLGTINPVKEIIRLAHLNNSIVLIDGAQALSHIQVDVQDLDCDFYTFSAHKVYGPMGIGGLYGKEKLLNAMPPWQGGGEMISTVSFARTTYNELPFKFEAGTPNVADVIGFGAALKYMEQLGIENIAAWERELLYYATQKLSENPNITIIGTAPEKTSVVSFLIDKVHPYDAGTILDQMGIAVRTGNHCTQPLMDRLGIQGTVRASMAFYNTKDEIDRLLEAIQKVEELFLQ